jgi:hypothetical protein
LCVEERGLVEDVEVILAIGCNAVALARMVRISSSAAFRSAAEVASTQMEPMSACRPTIWRCTVVKGARMFESSFMNPSAPLLL